MKKLSVLTLLPVIALTSCSKVDTEENKNLNSDSSMQELTWTKEVVIESKDELNNQITSTITTDENTEIIEVNAPYELPNWDKVRLEFYMEVKNWVVVWMWGISWKKWAQEKFVNWIIDQIVWKELKWLQVDTVSWASLVSYAFNEFLNTVNK